MNLTKSTQTDWGPSQVIAVFDGRGNWEASVSPDYKELVQALARDAGIKSAAELLRVVEVAAEALTGEGGLAFGPPESASGKVLEFCVRDAFKKAGFVVDEGPPGQHDGLVKPPVDAPMQKPIVLEIKSANLPTPARHNLRQLDDWVFDLSGEERIRRRGTMALNEFGPRLTQHKGLMVFNGPLGVPFEQRSSDWLAHNEAAFAEKHHLCIARFDHVLQWCQRARIDEQQRLLFWGTIQASGGALPPPESPK